MCYITTIKFSELFEEEEIFSTVLEFACMCLCLNLDARVLVHGYYVKVASQLSHCSALALLSSPHNLTKTLISPLMMDAHGFLCC